MMHGSLLRLLGVGCALVLAGACANGDDPSNSGFSISGVNPTQVTSASASSTGAPTTGDEGTTAAAMTTSDEGTTSPATTLTTTGVDPSTTTTGVDPSTTTGDDTTGVVMTTMEESTGDPPIPPMKDAQPKAGLYEHCVDPNVCDAPAFNTCLQLVDMAMNPTDGFCTKDCVSVVDCGVKPVGPAVQECLNIGPGENLCALKCAGGVADCPTGMVCVNIGLPNNGSGQYCF